MFKRNIGFDFGFGEIKGTDKFNNKVHFPTLFKTYTGKKIDFGTDTEYVAKIKGKYYSVGEAATIGSIVKEWDRAQALSLENISVFLGTALWVISEKANDNETEETEYINLSVGLPIDYFLQQKKELEEILKNLELNVEINGKEKKFVIESTTITQQGVGAFLALSLDENGNIKKNIDDKLYTYGGGLIDIGYRTVDYLRIVKRNKKFQISNEESGSIDESGISIAHKRVVDLVNKDYGLSLDVLELETAMREYDNKIIAYRKEIDLKEYLSAEYIKLANDIKQQILTKWKQIEMFGAIYLTGGGAPIVNDYLDFDADIKVQDDPAFANCRGYLAKLALEEKKEKKISEDKKESEPKTTKEKPKKK